MGRRETVRVAPSRFTVTSTPRLLGRVAVNVEKASRESTGWPLTEVITSPALRPAAWAGEPPKTRAMTAPFTGLRPIRFASSGVSVAVTAPIQALCTWP